MHFLEDFQRHKKYTGFGDCGFTWQKLENRFMRNALSLKAKQQGVLVKKVRPCASLALSLFTMADRYREHGPQQEMPSSFHVVSRYACQTLFRSMELRSPVTSCSAAILSWQ